MSLLRVSEYECPILKVYTAFISGNLLHGNCWNISSDRSCKEYEFKHIYTPETKFGGVYRSHPVVGRLVGRSVQRSVAFSFSNTTSYNDQAHGEKVQCTRKITPS